VSGGDYLLGMEPAEIARLERQHAVWREHTHAIWRLAGFGRGQTLVDLGSGPGFTSLELADLVGDSGRVIAVDASTTAINRLRETVEHRRLSNIQAVTADVTDFDLSGMADGLFARWLFCYLGQPDVVLRRVTSHLRPGATVAIIDYWNYLAIRMEPSSAMFRKVFQAVYDSFAEAGGSLDVAGTLPAVLDDAGFTVAHVQPVCQIGRPGSGVWRWVAEFQHLYLPVLERKGYLTRTEREGYEAWFREREESGSALLFAPPMLGVIAVKA